MSFTQEFEKWNWQTVGEAIRAARPSDVAAVLQKPSRDLHDFIILLSPVARDFLGQMCTLSQQITKRRFGNTMQMYVPLYLSNECQNICTYCGFSFNNKIPRLTLTAEQILSEARVIKEMGYEHVLLVTGEARSKVGFEYLKQALEILRPIFTQISIEVQPLEEEEYRQLRQLGLHAVLVYQETYNKDTYSKFHPKGRKADFTYRLETPERLGRSGIHKIGLGALIGLEDWRIDAFFVALHLNFLQRKFWKTRFSVSFPRLRPAEGAIEPAVSTSEEDLLQLVCAYRILSPELELSLSTREEESTRDKLMVSGITSISAGSQTEPGGYSLRSQALKQFDTSDERTPAELASVLKSKGYEPIWKDWESAWI